MDDRRQPRANVSAAGDSGKVIEFVQQSFFRQGLQDAEVKRGAANAAAGEGQTDQVVGGGYRGVDFARLAGVGDLLHFFFKDCPEGDRRILRFRLDGLVSRCARCVGHENPLRPLVSSWERKLS